MTLQARETLYVGAAMGIGSVLAYAVGGYSSSIAWLWLAALLLILVHLLVTSEPLGRPSRWDLAAPGLLILAFSPLYLLRLTAWPVQVNSDEVTIMSYAKQYSSAPHVDLFGLSQYFGHPAGLLVVWGHLGNLLGGIDLGHMRLLHALCGLLVIGASYAFFRQFFTLPWALLGSAVLGLNHSFLMISRMAMRENTPVLVEVVALTLLLVGLRKRNAFATFAGGAVAGLGYYVHFPGRMVFPLWLAFLVVLAIAYRDEVELGRTLR
ncbi:MAG TPA: glycosyltransferase family 39 protein, partial [Gaiellaceae bacterium]